MKKLIINADDLGLKSTINNAIFECFERNLVNSASIMTNMPEFEAAAELAQEKKISKKIGVHLVLTEGYPATEEIKQLSFLFNENGEFKRTSAKRLFSLKKFEKHLIFREYAAQIKKARKYGLPISHVDTHHQIHDAWPVLQIILTLIKDYQIPKIRILNNMNTTSSPYKKIYRRAVNLYLKNKNVNFSDLMGSQKDFLSAIHNNISTVGKTIEIMVHPDRDKNNILIDRFPNQYYDFDFIKEYKLNLIN